MMKRENLFSKIDMFSVIEHQKQQASKRVQAVDSNQLLTATEDEIVEQIVNEFRIEVPVMQDDKIYVCEHGETNVDVSRDPNRFIRDRSRSFYVNGTKTVIALPFEGDAELFKVQPNTYTTTHPAGEIAGKEIRLTYMQAEPNAEAVKRDYMKTLGEIKQYLDWQRPSADEFNSQLGSLVRLRVNERKGKIEAGSIMLDGLGLPTRKQ
jgi:hypothetical protein